MREDVACGSVLCAAHAAVNARLAHGCALSDGTEDGAGAHTALRAHACYVFPDRAAMEAYGEVFVERGCVKDVVVLKSTLVALAQSSRASARKAARIAREASMDCRKHVFAFDDAHCAGVNAVMEALDEQFGASRWRRERAAAAYYATKVAGKFPCVIVSDGYARELALDDSTTALGLPPGVVVCDVKTFAGTFCALDGEAAAAFESVFETQRADGDDVDGVEVKHEDDVEFLPSSAKSTVLGRKPPTAYDPHWSASDVTAGVADGSLVTGSLDVKALGVVCEGYVNGIFIPSKHAMNRAMHGDVVVVRVEPEDAWLASRVHVVDEDEGVRASDVSSSASHPPRRTGAVVAIIQRKTTDVVACMDAVDEEELVRNPHVKRNGALCVPMDGKLVKVKLLTRRAHELIGQRFIVRIDRWQTHQRYPDGHLVRVLGPAGDVDVEMSALLARFNIPSEPFGAATLAELPREGADWVVPQCEIDTRRDLRHHRACSIDPPGCTDVDDALSVYANGDSLEVGVHIADVSYFVREGSLLDYEARARGTTVYLVDRRLDMLPELLSENLASLLEGRDRLAMSCVWTLDERLNIVDVWFGRSVIHSRHQMTYYQAQAIYDDAPTPPGVVAFDDTETKAVREDLKTLVAFANRVNAVRVSRGAVELESAELRFETDAQTKSPTEVIHKQEVPMMRVVAELMILANSAAAKATHGAFPGCAFLRRHAPPRADGFEELTRLAAAQGVSLDCSSGETLNASLARVAATSDADVTTLFKGLATRAMSEAQYVSSGSISPEAGFGHYGLALTYYTHFTSPIRRYADIIVHRQLIAAVEARANASGHAALEPVATHLNERNRASKHAQSRCGEIYLLWLLREKPMIEPAIVHEVRDDGVLVFLPSFHIKAPVRLTDANGCAIKELRESEFDELPSPDGTATWVQARPCVGVEGTTAVRRTNAKGIDVLDIIRVGGDVERSYSLLQKVWVELSCRHSRTYGPKLELRILDAAHHTGAREAVAQRSAVQASSSAAPPPASLSSVMRHVVESQSVSESDNDAFKSGVRDRTNTMHTHAKRSRRNASIAVTETLSRLNLDDAADDWSSSSSDECVVVADDDDELWIPRKARARGHPQSTTRSTSQYIARRKAADAWARLVATRPYGADGRARFERRLARAERLQAAATAASPSPPRHP